MFVVLALKQALAKWLHERGAAKTQKKKGPKKVGKTKEASKKKDKKKKEEIEEFELTEGMGKEVVNPEIAVALLGPAGPRIVTAAAVEIFGPRAKNCDGGRRRDFWPQGQEL